MVSITPEMTAGSTRAWESFPKWKVECAVDGYGGFWTVPAPDAESAIRHAQQLVIDPPDSNWWTAERV